MKREGPGKEWTTRREGARRATLTCERRPHPLQPCQMQRNAPFFSFREFKDGFPSFH